MTQPGPVQDPPPDPRQEGDLLRLDFFTKLGFSAGEVQATLHRLGPATDTNSVLGELVGSRSQRPAGRPCSPGAATATAAAGDQRSTAWQREAAGPGGRPGPGSRTVSAPTSSPPPSSSTAARPGEREREEEELKGVVIDGSNVAMSHGNKEVFSCQGILLAVNYFLLRGHTTVTVFVPSWRKEQPRPDARITDQYILTELEKRKILVFTPSRRVGGKRVVCYDDRFIVRLAHELDAVIVSNDTYQDLQAERPEWRRCIEERLLMYSFVNDKFMPPDDPLGRHGPSLDNFLRKTPLLSEPNRPLCPYDRKCTYGLKCKFYHPERGHQAYSSLADELREKARISTATPNHKLQLLPRGAASNPRALDLETEPWPYTATPDHKYQLLPRGAASNPRALDLETESWPYTATPDHKYQLLPRGAASNPRALDVETEPWPSPERRGPAARPARVTENFLVCQEGGRTTQNHASATWGQTACPSSGQSQDSGLGSYEFTSDGLPSPWSSPPQPPLYVERSMCGCFPPAGPYQRSPSPGPKYDTYPPHPQPPSMHQYYSLPGCPPQAGLQSQTQHHQQPKYWSVPPEARGPCGPSGPRGGPPRPGGHGGAYRDHVSDPWAPPGTCSPAFDPDRLDLRKKLQAIFNPYQVNAVMQMFPHLTDAQKLAAEILKLKAQGEVF